ncbi:MAG: hypothetical protein IJ859_00510 [Synergistaceae bacterium]|nr:hypothetical protein [Synergistaceae bacterium]
MPVIRNNSGQFVKGQSGNPGGRPSPKNAEVKEILKAASVDAAKRLVELSLSDNEKIALPATVEILNRTEGKPRESVSMDVNGGLDVRAQIRSVLMERLNGQSGINEPAE